MSKRYTVACYDNWDVPHPRWWDEGEFDTAREAVARAKSIILGQLQMLYRENHEPDAEGLYMAYLAHGEVPSVFGEPEAGFDTYKAVRFHIRQITGGSVAVR